MKQTMIIRTCDHCGKEQNNKHNPDEKDLNKEYERVHFINWISVTEKQPPKFLKETVNDFDFCSRKCLLNYFNTEE